MIERGKINDNQFRVLVILFIFGPAVLLETSLLAAAAKQDAWISAVVGVGIGLLIVWLYTKIGSKFPERNLFEKLEYVFGKWIGKIVSLLFFFFFFQLAAHILRNIGDFVTVHIMPETPIHFVEIIFLCIVIMGVRLGLEPIARTGEILFPWVIFFFFIMIVSLPPEFKIENIKPVFEGGIKPILKGSTTVIAFPFMESILFLMIYPYVNKIKEANKAFFTGALIGGGVLILISVYTILVLGADFTARNVYPSYALAKKINIADFFQRIEAIVAGMWFISIFYKLTICFYASTVGLAQILNLKEYRSLTLPLGMIMVVLSIIISPSMAEFMSYLPKYEFPFNLTFGLFFPLLFLVVAKIRKKTGKEPMNQTKGDGL
ncbi:GerAB/ArcD/ProY family transporter [Neobacillus kokaensis]|uniref:Germination protein n=1 Tax=Neobacillus kokaensis TaxID=2759023 RepID=A0ABQ3NB08_9BACI|nr:endospore germination permease [Neobacillus kokaensis]GHI01095.1 germination protein [Neobacillus kokaensis]